MEIKNGDTPAMPTVYAYMLAGAQGELYCDNLGLTKREQFAMAAMQGILSSQWYADFTGASQYYDKPEAAAEIAVKHADALLAELEK